LLVLLEDDGDSIGISTRRVALHVEDDGRVVETDDGVVHTVVVDVDERRVIDRILHVVSAVSEGD
jgi:hypothetical protein